MRPYRAALIILTTAGILAAAGPARKPKTQFLNPQGVPKPTGYTQVVSSGPGRMIFISGQGGADQMDKCPKTSRHKPRTPLKTSAGA